MKTSITMRKTQLAAAVALVAAVGSMPGHTQMLEEVVVTATKRAEGLQNVPIAIAVVSGEKIEQFGITELDELAAYLPGVHIGESGGNNQVFIRGVGSGNNAGFEQSVGTFIDGVYFGRARNSRAAFLDLARVEVLKGPQSTLFGKNTIAGAINITTGQPEDAFEGYVEGSYETELEGIGVTGMVTGPLTDNVRYRLVAKTYERDGWMDNIYPGADGGASQENDIIRGTLVWDATDKLSFNLKGEHGEFGTVGANSKITIAPPGPQFLFGLNDPNFSDTVNFGYKQSQTKGLPGRAITDDTDSNILQLTATYQAGDYEIRSITAYTDYDYDKCSDVDYASIDFLDQCTEETHEQFTQEFLLSSPLGGTFEYLAGVYYQDAKLEFANNIGAHWSNVPPVEAGLFALLGLTGAPAGTVDGRLATSVEQNTETWSAFVELTWNMTDSFRTIFGVRYSDDEKDIDKVNTITSFDGNSILPDAVLGGIYTAIGFYTTYEYELERAEDHVTGNLNFQWDATDDMMAYLNFATGYKAGGFDTGNSMDRSREFEDEGVDSIELGLKWTVWDGRARVNAAYFKGDYEDVQVSSFEGSGFVVGNAAETDVEGIEADFEVAATDSITINAAFAWLDAEYSDYTNGPCTVDGRLDGTCSGATGGQDLSGAPLQFAPDFSGNLGITYFTSITDSVDLLLGADVIYTDDIVIAPTGDKNVIQDSYTKVNARIALESSDGTWSLSLVGKNLTDETTFNWGNDATLSGDGLGFDRSYFHQLEAPRTYEIQARYSF
jgi:iron complex outermembrane receptor protein